MEHAPRRPLALSDVTPTCVPSNRTMSRERRRGPDELIPHASGIYMITVEGSSYRKQLSTAGRAHVYMQMTLRPRRSTNLIVLQVKNTVR